VSEVRVAECCSVRLIVSARVMTYTICHTPNMSDICLKLQCARDFGGLDHIWSHIRGSIQGGVES